MATPHQPSTECIYNSEEVNVIGCICQTKDIELIQTSFSEIKINTKLERRISASPCIKDQLAGYVCSIILVCSHYLEIISTTLAECKQVPRLILVGNEKDLARLHSPGIASVSSDEPDFLQILADMIQTKINYDDCFDAQTTKGHQKVDVAYKEESVYDECKYQLRKSVEPLDPKYTQGFDHNKNNYTEYLNERTGDENPYLTLALEPRANLINLKTGKSGKDILVGTNVVEEYFHPSRHYWKEPSEIVADINSGNKATVSELTKHVYTNVIRTAQEHGDLLTLSKLSECEGHGIEDRIAKEIQNLLFTTEVNSHSLDVLLGSLEVHLTVVMRKAVSSKTSRTILPNVILMLTLVYYIVLGKDVNEKDMDRRLSILNELLDNTRYAPNQIIEPLLLNATKKMIEGLKKVRKCKKPSCPQLLGCWREELMNDNTISNITSAIAKMSLPVKYSLIVRLLVQIHLGMELSERLIDFIHTSVKNIAKKSENPQLYPLLVIVCRGIASLLNRHVHQGDIKTGVGIEHDTETLPTQSHQQTPDMQTTTNNRLYAILDTCVGKIKHKPDCKKALQDELMILLFHRSSHVAKAAHESMSASGTVCLADKIPAYLQTILGPLGLILCQDKPVDRTTTLPRWQEFKGYIAGQKQVSINVLLPDNNTFDLKTYIRSAKQDPSNGRHYNTLEMLKILLGNDQHPNIRRLMAFQFQPMPVFYMAERLSDATLSTFLLTTRNQYDWQPLRTLGVIALACVDVAHFLHKRGIVHRNLIAASFKRRDQATFVLADFSIASLVDDDSVGSGTFVQDIDGKFIPTRWSAPESLLADRYDATSDTWMIGLLINEIFTHGVHPFRDMYGTKLDDIMENVVFNNLTPRWYPCIPCPVHAIIAGCVKTKPEERLKLSQVLQRLRDWLELLNTHNEKMPKLQHATFSTKNSEYPELDDLQREPERGPTEQLRELKKLNQDPRVSYYNSVELRRLSMYPDQIQIKEEHLKAADHPTIEKRGGCLEIREPVSKAFMKDTYPKMTSKPNFMMALTIDNNPEKHPRSSTNPNGFIHTLIYRCQNADSLHEIAQIHKYGDPHDDKNACLYLQVIESLLKFVNWMHERHWILRDICSSTTFRAVQDGRVFMPRLGRMIKDQRRISRIEACIIDKDTCIDDRRNWMPAEVIDGGQFSQASDVYMVAMTIYEFYSTADLSRGNPMHNRLASVPFAKVDPKLLLETLNRGTVPQKPNSCPQWLYDLMLKCWDRDSTKRMTAVEILSEISERITTAGDVTHVTSMLHNISGNRESGNSDSSVTFRKEVYTPCQPPTLPQRKNNNTSKVSFAENLECCGRDASKNKDSLSTASMDNGHTPDERHGMIECSKLQLNDYQTFPVDKVRSSKSGRVRTAPISSHPVYIDSASIYNNQHVSEATDYHSSTYSKKAASMVDNEPAGQDVILLGIDHQINNSRDMAITDGYLTCEYSSTEGESGNDKNTMKLNSLKKLLHWQPVPSTTNTTGPSFHNRLSGEIHQYDNVHSFYRPQNQRHSTCGIDVVCSCGTEGACSCKPIPHGTEGACSCGNSSCETGSTVSCGNSSCETGSVVSCGNSSSETGSVVSCGNSSCETGSVVSFRKSSCETGSVVMRK